MLLAADRAGPVTPAAAALLTTGVRLVAPRRRWSAPVAAVAASSPDPT